MAGSGDEGGSGRGAAPLVEVEVAAGIPQRQAIVSLKVPAGTTVAEAVRRSAILDRFPEFHGDVLDHAVHGVRAAPEQVLVDGDRVEILRPLRVDPRESRRRRARRSR